MWTNIFKIGELQTVSWFQFLPVEPDSSTTSERSSKTEQNDVLNSIVLSAYLHLQSEGFLSTWTNSFVGPWDPSQGEHNPDEKIKLWLFLSGRHSSVPEMTHPAVAKLRVVSNGLWVAPGSSEEVAAALCQALRNSLERALRGLSYARFGDVFTKYNPPTRNQNSFRRAQPTVEFVFAATEEAIFVHVVISARYMRNLSSDDIEKVLTHSPLSVGEGLPVVVAPSGMLGRLVGCYPSDLVRQVYSSKLSAPSLPGFTQPTVCQLRGQSYYVEVAFGFPAASTDKISESENSQIKKELDSVRDPHLGDDGQRKLESADSIPVLERTFIYPPTAVMVPMVHQAFVRVSSKRMWSQGCMGSSSWEAWPFWNFSPSSYFRNSSCLGSSRGLGVNSNFLRLRRQKNSNCNGMASSISSVSSTSNGSEHAVAAKGGDLLADADSTACHQSNLPLNNDVAGSKMVSKRSRYEITEVSSHAGKEVRENMQGANGQGGCSWGWDEEGVVMDINLLLSEFGDFSDFFQEDELDFGEPPGTAESHALVPPASEYDVTFTDSPSMAMDIPEQRLSPVGFTSLEAFNNKTMSPIQDVASKVQEPQKDIASPAGSQSLVLSSGRFDFITRAEAALTFAPEYAAVEISVGEMPTTLFTNPYLPGSKKRGSCGFSSRVYSYDVAQSSQIEPAGDKLEKSVKLTTANLSRDVGLSNLYTLVQGGKKYSDKRLNNTDEQSCKGETSRPVFGETSSSSSLALQKKSDSMLNVGYFLLSMKTALATEIECITFQAAMCRIRHTLLSLRTKASAELKSALPSFMHTEVSSKSDLIPKYDIKRKENIPARLSNDVDHEMYDRSLLEGVWRPVGAPKGAKPLESLPAKTFTGSSPSLSVQRQPIVDLLSAMALLVQQSTSFVDIALDMDDGDGSFFWLSLDEQKRRGFSCDPSMVHSGCGGLLGTCHSKDCAGVDLVDPLSAEVSESSMVSLLQSDIKTALKTAFGNMDGPLLVIDWCRGRSNVAESAAMGDVYSFQYSTGDIRESSNSIPIGGDAMSPPQSSSDRGTSELEHHKGYHRVRPTIAVLPSPSLLVGYQDDWLKTSANCLKLWEKAPLEPYASPKPVTYYALCPDIDMLTSAATDFFLQLGTIYEVCKLGTHSPQNSGGQMEQSPGKYLPSGLVLVECPDQVKTGSSHSISVSSITEYLQALSKNWSVKSFVTSLARIIKDIKLTSSISTNQKESSNIPCTVIYVVCPFPEPSAVLQTLVESSVALGSVILSPERERKLFLYSQVAKALNCSASADEASASNVVMLSGFSIPKLVLQIVTVETLLRLHKPNNELAAFKDIAFTVYNKARRIPRVVSTSDMFQSPTYMGRSQSTMMHATSPGPTLWKECLVPRMPGPALSRETEFDASMRPVSWDNSWQPGRAVGLPDQSKIPDLCAQDDRKYAFEPLFILAESGSVDYNDVMESSRSGVDASSSRVYSSISGGTDSGANPLLEGSENDSATSLHCCYGWTEDWRWLVCIWTDSRGELLDSLIFPFGGISSRQDTKVLQSLFIQILQQGCQIMSSAPEASNMRPRDVIITRTGGFLELEIQEWQKAIYSFGGNEVKKWPVQLRRSIPDGIPSNSNGPTLQQQDMGLIHDRNMPSSPSPLYSPHSKSSFTKGQSGNKKQILVEQTGMDSSRGSLHLVRSISLVVVSQDHSLHLACQADLLARPTSGEGNQSSSGSSSYLEGFTPVKSIGSMSASYLLVPSPSMRYLSPATLQLPTCLTSESPPLAHLLHSKGTAIPLAMGYVVSKAVPPVRKDSAQLTKEDRHSVLLVSIVDYYGGSTATVQEKMSRGVGGSNTSKQARNIAHETTARNYEMDMHNVLEAVAAELHSLSWMTVSPVYTERRSALPFHCDMVLRLRRLLHYADRHLSQPTEKGDVA